MHLASNVTRIFDNEEYCGYCQSVNLASISPAGWRISRDVLVGGCICLGVIRVGMHLVRDHYMLVPVSDSY
jgi:hypothetical protein